MKTLLISLALLANSLVNVVAASTVAAPTDEPKTHTLTVRFDNVQQRSGTLNVAIYNDDPALNGAAFRKVRLTVPAEGEITLSVADLPAGRYAIRSYQDLNGNFKLDYNGPMPTEPYGLSNITQLMAPPTFEQMAFPLDGNKAIEIRMIN